MNFSVIPSDRFKKEAKRLIKEFPTLKQELADLSNTPTNAPATGTPLGNDPYKIRLAIKSKGKGKSGGGRVITYVVTDDKKVYLLPIYDKFEFDSIDDKTLRIIISSLSLEK